MRSLAIILLALGFVLPAHAVRRFDYAFDEAATTVIDDATPMTIGLTADADDTLVVCTIVGNLSTPTISDDQDNVWETVVTQDGSGHRISCWVKCDASAAAYVVELVDVGETFLVTTMLEYSGGDTTSCIQNSAGNENTADTSPFTGPTVTSTSTALILGVGGASGDLTMSDGTERDSGSSVSSIRMSVGDKRATSASTWNTEWTFSGTIVTVGMAIAIGEAAGGAPSVPAAIFSTPTSRGGKR